MLRKIEAVFEDIALALLNERGTLGIDLKSRDGRASRKPAPTGERPVESVRDVQRRVCFPGKTEKEAWQFSKTSQSWTTRLATMADRICSRSHPHPRSRLRSLTDGRRAVQTVSHICMLLRRLLTAASDIYYRDPALFNKQYTVDRYVDDIAYTFGVTRSALNVTAVAKGLVAGATTFCRRDGTTVDAAADREGMLVPSLKDVLSVCMAAVQWILVVEKEATFRSIAASAFWKTISTSGVLVTAKGYPDLATRALLHLLSTPSPQNSFLSPPVYCLVDYDADGLAILFTYKYGSAKLAHESSDLQLPQLRWLGLRSNDVFSAKTLDQSEQGLLTLSKRDRRKARLMLGWNALTGDDEICDELRTMLMLDFKAELQILDGTPNGMVNLLENGLH